MPEFSLSKDVETLEKHIVQVKDKIDKEKARCEAAEKDKLAAQEEIAQVMSARRKEAPESDDIKDEKEDARQMLRDATAEKSISALEDAIKCAEDLGLVPEAKIAKKKLGHLRDSSS
eukprot:GEMP01067685.1.p3 GENE.GEMP01067685.1~~GEMP01067685.1.p3  ORF type:complete len:117 (+),score=49.99 GEMP01067685.1:193-543(+)